MYLEDIDDPSTCPRCGAPHAWDGDTDASRVCMSCRADDAELWAEYERERGDDEQC